MQQSSPQRAVSGTDHAQQHQMPFLAFSEEAKVRTEPKSTNLNEVYNNQSQPALQSSQA